MASDSHVTDSGATQLSAARKVLYGLLVPLVYLLLRLLYATYRISIEGEEHLQRAASNGQPVIPCYWHQMDLVLAVFLLTRKYPGFRSAFLVSPSKDGEVGARIVKYFGGRVLRGSSTRTGAQAMRDLYMAIHKDGWSPANTPDGGHGPVYKFKPGAVMLSQMTGVAMIPLAASARSARYLSTWDRFMIPMPFTKVAIKVGEARITQKKEAGGDVAMDTALMEQALNRLTLDCRSALGIASDEGGALT